MNAHADSGEESGAIHSPVAWLKATIEGGEFAVALQREGEPLRRVDDPDEVDEYYADGLAPPSVVLYLPDEMLVHEDSIENHRAQVEELIGEAGDYGEYSLYRVRSDIDPLEIVRETLRLDEEPVPYPGYGVDERNPHAPDAVALVHGFRFWSHVHLWSHVHWWSHVHLWNHMPVPAGEIGRGVPPNAELPPAHVVNPGRPLIGVIDTGADLEHSWLGGGIVVSKSPIQPGLWPHGHGTVVTGIIRQGVDDAKIIMERVEFRRNQIVEEKQVYKALEQLIDEGCTIINMSFGGETFGRHTPLEQRLNRFKNEQGGTTVAAAGNLEHDDASHLTTHSHSDPLEGRRPYAPASFSSVIGVAGGPAAWWYQQTTPGPDRGVAASYYPWSNGGPWVDAIVAVDGARHDEQWVFSSYPTVKDQHGPLWLDRFCAAQGTSVLTPLIVAGLAVGAANPAIDNAQTSGRV